MNKKEKVHLAIDIAALQKIIARGPVVPSGGVLGKYASILTTGRFVLGRLKPRGFWDEAFEIRKVSFELDGQVHTRVTTVSAIRSLLTRGRAGRGAECCRFYPRAAPTLRG